MFEQQVPNIALTGRVVWPDEAGGDWQPGDVLVMQVGHSTSNLFFFTVYDFDKDAHALLTSTPYMVTPYYRPGVEAYQARVAERATRQVLSQFMTAMQESSRLMSRLAR